MKLDDEIRRIHTTMRMMAAEIAGLRRTMLDAGLVPPPPSLDANHLSVREYAELHHISEEAVYKRIKRSKKLRAIKARDGRSWAFAGPGVEPAGRWSRV